METYTLRWSADRSIYFIEPRNGRNARGFWMAAEKSDYPVAPELIKNPYSGAFAFRGYYRRWFSMRGFIVKQGDPQSGVPGDAELVRDYIEATHLITTASLVFVNRNAADAAAAQEERRNSRATTELDPDTAPRVATGSGGRPPKRDRQQAR